LRRYILVEPGQHNHGAVHGRRILYAEDSIVSQKIVKRMLERAGAQCTLVDNGELAVHAALHAYPPFDCILMDCDMPVCNGWEATRQIQMVGRRRLTVSKPVLKAPMVSALETRIS